MTRVASCAQHSIAGYLKISPNEKLKQVHDDILMISLYLNM